MYKNFSFMFVCIVFGLKKIWMDELWVSVFFIVKEKYFVIYGV